MVIGNTSGSALGILGLTLDGGSLASPAGSVGRIGGPVNAGTGNNYITPGGDGQIGALSLNGLTLNDLSKVRFDINGTSSLDQINDTGTLGFNGPGAATFLVTGNLGNGTYPLINFAVTGLTSTSDFSLAAISGGTAALNGYSLVLTGANNAQLELVVSNGVSSGPTTWQGASSMSWTDSGNWSGGVPNGTGVTAVVGSATANPATITLDGPQTLGQLTLSASSAAVGYTLASGSGGLLIMSNTGSAAAQILIPSGSHSITAPVVLAGALSIQPTAGMTLNILGNISEMTAGSGSLSLDGPGTLILGGSDSYTGGTTLTAGTLIVTSSTSLAPGTNLTVGGGSTFVFDPSQAAAPAAGGGVNLAAVPAGAVTAVPEPGSLALLVAGLAVGVGIARRRRKGA